MNQRCEIKDRYCLTHRIIFDKGLDCPFHRMKKVEFLNRKDFKRMINIKKNRIRKCCGGTNKNHKENCPAISRLKELSLN